MSTYTNAFGGIAASYRLPFGKHSGRLLSEVPVDYLVWLAESAESPVMRSIARAALGVEDNVGEDATDPSPELAAVALPGIVFEWQEAMRAEFKEDAAASVAVERGLKLLKENCSRFTNRPWLEGGIE